LVNETSDAAECMIVLEDLIMLAMGVHLPEPRRAGEVLDFVTANVIERLDGKGVR
jgi:hypothetical protein